MIRPSSVAVAVAIAVSACSAPQQPAAPVADQRSMADNPFALPSSLPYQAPQFDRIRDEHYGPAIEQGMREQLAEIAAITGDSAAPTFANTIEALERSGQMLTRAARVFFAMTSANTNPELQRLQGEFAPKLAAHKDAIWLDEHLFARVHQLFERRAELGLAADQAWLLEKTHRDFVRAGSLLGAMEKVRLRTINKELSALTTAFQRVLLAATKADGVLVADRTQLAGLADGDVAAAEAAATAAGKGGKWLLALQNTTQQPVLASLEDRGVRERVLAASMARGAHGGENDTRGLAVKTASLRAEKAKLLGYPTWADYVLADQMATTPQRAIGLLTDMVPAATGKARAEVLRMQKEIDAGGGKFALAASDWSYYAERVRKAEYDLDEAAIRPYFEVERVMRDGLFFMAHELYGLTFVPRPELPVYHPDVRAFEVRDADGKGLALWYCDWFQRDNKNGGAWMDSFVDQSSLLAQKAAVFNVCNFTKPAAGQPALLSFDDVTTMFHEFGHALHGMLSAVRYPSQSGTNVPRDFVEYPSQFHEHFVTEPRVFANFARHWKTGEPMPKELVERLERSKTFNQGYATTEYLAAALLDMAWHSLPMDETPKDVVAFEQQALKRFGVDMPQVPPRYRSTYFAHIFSGEYAAGYYAYMWSEVLDDDTWDWFVENGGMTRANGTRYRDLVLSRGGTSDPAAMFRAFRGRDPSVAPLLRERGLE